MTNKVNGISVQLCVKIKSNHFRINALRNPILAVMNAVFLWCAKIPVKTLAAMKIQNVTSIPEIAFVKKGIP